MIAVDTNVLLRYLLYFHKLAGEPLAGAAKTGNDLIHHQQHVVFPAHPADLLEIVARWYLAAAGALDWLGKKSRHPVGANLQDPVLQPARRGNAKFFFTHVPAVLELARTADMFYIRDYGSLLVHPGHARQGAGGPGTHERNF